MIEQMNIRLPEITESAEELKDRLRCETRGRQKQRIQALYLLKTGQAYSCTQVGHLLGVGRRAVGKWLDRYRAEGLAGMLEIRTHTNRSRSLTPEQEEHLRRKLSEPEGFESWGAVQSWVNKTFGLELPYTTVYGIAHDEMGARLKVARKSHTKKQTSG
jgi:transposase